ncbi:MULTISPECIES: SusC/RagA family TonB-linked outer membrane protein [Flavobacteriaceae]|uniref:TonB-dependent receptor n=2 Tax=Flavobacteriaceae TaxID=49546 RepID=A0A4Y8APE1_9FLAO|nr:MULTISPECIES: TonB-dependent receptor [Flavobacteriaceae]TEW72502.1 TonB-dependent receptor [Gramella jeungdoensis]GGK55224.1 SusC/RagA family TonB-linked outer membrane protein [Lutibacter litoralis]
MKSIILSIFVGLMGLIATGQTYEINGIVSDSGGNPLPGVSIVVKNTTKGVSTDFDGNFTIIEVQNGEVLVFSYLGFITKEVVINNANYLEVVLADNTQSLEEVVVIGYGTQTKKEITGAVTVVGSETIEKLKPTQVEQALQGQVAGVNVTTNSGSPGGSSTISIRGVSTNGDSRPLILVDGNVVEDLSVVNPNDIESINILKDATAGIYGVRAANGVILITTKTGRKEMPLTVEYNGYLGLQSTTRKMPVLNASEYALIVNEAFAAGGSTPPFTNISDIGAGTNWQNKVFEIAPIQSHNVSLKGGRKKSSYSHSTSYLTQDGIVGGDKSNFKRFTTSLSYNLDLLENFKFKSGVTATSTNKKNLPENALGSVLFNALNMAPNLPVRDSNGEFSLADGLGGEVINPIAQMENTYNTTRVIKYNGFAGLKYTFLDHFTAEANYQFNYAEVRSKSFDPVDFYGVGKVFNTVRSSVFEGFDVYRDYTFDGFIKYENTFNDTHKVNVLLGTSVFKTTGSFSGMIGRDITDNNVANAFVDKALEKENIYAELGRNPTFDARLLSYFTRLQYDYKGKYLLSAVVRRDGSTRFGPGNKFGYFPSGSIGWIISDEDFMSDNNFFQLLKVRASYGILGNDRIPDYRFTSLLTGEGTYFFGGNDLEDEYYGVASGPISNPEIKWEKQKTFDIGLDLRFLDNKIDITTDYFKRRTEDLLVSPQVSGLLGTGAAPVVNAGIVENEGIEFAIGFSETLNDDFKFSIKYNVTAIKNKVIAVSGDGEYLEGGQFGISQPAISRMEAGYPLGYFVGYETNGIFQNQSEIDNTAVTDLGAQPGDLRFVDQNGDGVIDLDDRIDLGNPLPDATMGLNISFDYKKWDFAAYAFASVGNEIVRNYERNQALVNKPNFYLDRWTGEGTSNSSPRVTTGASSNTVFSDFYVEDGSFIRLQNVQLGYTFNTDSSDSSVEKLRIYLSGSNLLTLTEYSGYDPTAGTGIPIGGGIDQGFYPNAASLLLGVNLKF